MPSKTLLSLLAATGAFLHAEMASGQALPPSVRTPQADKTLGTQVTGNGNNFNITGGLNRGQTLFHSFKDFSIPTGGAANFNNPVGTRDIITRVTGNLFSDINGTLNSNGANFLLINPNGVVFGPNARLNVGKAFAASTASGVDLIDGQGGRYTFGTNANGDAPLLTVNPNVFFNVSQLNMGAKVPGNAPIINYGTLKNQTNNPGQYIGLIGGDVGLIGGEIIAPGGKVELGGLSQAGGIGFSFDKGLQFPANVGRGDVVLVARGTSPSVINVESAGGGGSVDIFAKDITLRGAETKVRGGIAAGDSPNAKAGDIKFDATGNVTLFTGDIFNQVAPGGVGKGGNIDITARNLSLTNGAQLGASTFGQGDAGNVKITATGDIFVDGGQGNLRSGALSTVESGGVGKGGNIDITARNLSLTNGAQLQASTVGKGDAGNVKITATGDIFVDGGQGNLRSGALSTVESGGVGKGGNIDITAQNLSLTNAGQLLAVTRGKGDAGNVTVKVSGDIDIAGIKDGFGSGIFSYVDPGVIGNGGNINVTAGSFSLRDGTKLEASTSGQGNAGNIDITTTGNLTISGTQDSTLLQQPDGVARSKINSSTFGQGNAGKITINTGGKLSVLNKGGILSEVRDTGVGNSNGIKIDAGELEIANRSSIQTTTKQAKLVKDKGNAGNIDIKTKGNLTISGTENPTFLQERAGVALSSINSSTEGQGDAGKITIDTAGKLSVLNRGGIFSAIDATGVGNSNGIKIDAGELDIANQSSIQTPTSQAKLVKDKGNAGDITISTNGNLTIIGTNNSSDSGVSGINSSSVGAGDAGKVTINTQGNKLFLSNRAAIFSAIKEGVGNSKGVKIDTGDLNLTNGSAISTGNVGGLGNAGDVVITSKGKIDIVDSIGISSFNFGLGKAGNISLTSNKLNLNKSPVLTNSFFGSGGDLKLDIKDYLLLRNNSAITTNSASQRKNGNGGNITIDSPLIVALPGNNDISANAFQGSGGKVNITSQGLFGIKFRPKGQDSLFTNDITASSTFGQSGTVNISTPGTDPGKDSTVLPNVPTDASNQIAQACGASRENKFIVAGRGGLPSNANDPLTSDVVWQDARGTNSQPTASSATTDPTKLAPPATGLVFDGKGKATLIAAGTQGQPTGTSVVCPTNVVRK